jgi:hypothetical protein
VATAGTMELRGAEHTAGGHGVTCSSVHTVGDVFMSYLVSQTEWGGTQIALQKSNLFPW